MSEKHVDPQILVQTLLVMATFAMAKTYSEEDIREIFELHQKNMIDDYGFNRKDVMAVTGEILRSLQSLVGIEAKETSNG